MDEEKEALSFGDQDIVDSNVPTFILNQDSSTPRLNSINLDQKKVSDLA